MIQLDDDIVDQVPSIGIGSPLEGRVYCEATRKE